MAYNPFENNFIHMMGKRVDSASFEKKPLIMKAHNRAERLFASDAIRPQDFADLYDPEQIKKDLAYVEMRKASFEGDKGSKMAADVLEAIMYEHTELSNWWGEHASTVKTSEYDDIANGVDLVVEFNEPRRSAARLAVGIDATFGVGSVGGKLQRIKSDLDKGKLATIKYYKSANSNFRGELSNIPRVVVGTEKDTVLRLANLWTENEKRQLGEHPIQRLVLEQTFAQLVAYSDYATRIGNHELGSSFEHDIALTEEALREKRSIRLGELEDDKVHAEIMHNLDMFRRGNA